MFCFVCISEVEQCSVLHSSYGDDCLFLQFPVYFAFENEETDAMLADVKKNDALGQQATATTGGLVS